MVTLVLDPVNAEPFVDDVHARDSTLGDRIEDSFDELEAAPEAATYRRHLHRIPGRPELDPVWAYTVRHGPEEVMVVWRQDGDLVRVLYVGPSIY